MTRIAGAVAVVTGGGSGIGLGVGRELSRRGAQVVLADIDLGRAQAAAGDLGALALGVDVADADSVRALSDEVAGRFGRVDIVVNNAGIGPRGDLGAMSLNDWRIVVDINLWGVVHGVHAFLPLLEANPEGGHIVNTASMASFVASPGLGAYGATKAAVLSLTESLAAELAAKGSPVKATALIPGPTRTDIKNSLARRPELRTDALSDIDIEAEGWSWLVFRSTDHAGWITADAIEKDELYAITHPMVWPRVEQRNELVHAAFAAAARRDAQGHAALDAPGTVEHVR